MKVLSSLRGQTPEKVDADDDGLPGNHKSGMFCDTADLKKQMRENMLKPTYDVCDFYKDKGICQKIARSQPFEYTTLGVIAFNALWMWVDTDLNGATVLLQAHPVFQVAEHAFCAYFTWEWAMRFGAFKYKRNGLKDAWFVFDSFMVFMMVSETWIMTAVMLATGAASGGGLGNASMLRLLRLLRLSRMARMAKLLRSMPELLILVKGMVAAMRSVFFTLMLLMIVIYVFAIAFRQLMDGTEAGKVFFPSIAQSMHTLFRDGTIMDGTGNVVALLEAESFIYVAIFYFFVVIAALMVMNMLIGVLCEVVSAVACSEKEQIATGTVKDGIEHIIKTCNIDEDENGMISRKEFKAIMGRPQTATLLNSVDVDVFGLVDLEHFIFANDDSEGEKEKELPFEDFMELVLSLRGSNSATVKDIVDLRKWIKDALEDLENKVAGKKKAPSKQTTSNGQRMDSRKPSQAESDDGKYSSDASCHGTGNAKSALEPCEMAPIPGTEMAAIPGTQEILQDTSQLECALNVASMDIQMEGDTLQLPQQVESPAGGEEKLSQSARLENALATALCELQLFSQTSETSHDNANGCNNLQKSLNYLEVKSTPGNLDVMKERASVAEYHLSRFLDSLKSHHNPASTRASTVDVPERPCDLH